jgi:multicomponent Na+:H+ antiporter subunit F
MTPHDVLEMAKIIAMVLLCIALMLAFVRLVLGPSLPDRVVALDLIAAISAGFITVYAIDRDQHVFVDAAIVLSLITFLGTVAFTQYLERRARDD